MRKLGKLGGGQIYAPSHHLITGVLKKDIIDWVDQEMIFHRTPQLGELVNALVLAYGQLEPEMRRTLMGRLLANLQSWQEEKPDPSSQEIANAMADILRSLPARTEDVKEGPRAQWPLGKEPNSHETSAKVDSLPKRRRGK